MGFLGLGPDALRPRFVLVSGGDPISGCVGDGVTLTVPVTTASLAAVPAGLYVIRAEMTDSNSGTKTASQAVTITH